MTLLPGICGAAEDWISEALAVSWDVPFQPHLMIESVGDYDLIERIAVGGVAQIFRARRRDGRGSEVALKLLLAKYSDSEEHRQMMIDEAQISAQLDHPNIVKIRDLGEDGDRIFLIMDYVHGTDLTGVLNTVVRQNTSVPFDIATHIAMEVCSGLHYAHTFKTAAGEPLQLIHRDVSPHNVLIGDDGQVKLIDFGVAKTSMRGRMETRTGIIKGKLSYMAPEYAIGTQQDARSDVFAVGLCLYEMVTGRLAYGHQDPQELVRAVKFANIAPPAIARPDLPDDLEAVILGALQQQPADRFQSALQMHHALAGVLRRIAPRFERQRVATWIADFIDGAPPAPATTTTADVPTDETDLLDDDFAEASTQAFQKPSDPDDIQTLGHDNSGPRIPGRTSSSGVGEHGSDASLATSRLTDTAVRRALAGRNDDDLDVTGPLKSANLVGLDGLRSLAEPSDDDIAVLQTMALENADELPPLAGSDVDASGVDNDISEDMIAAMPTATDIDVSKIRGDNAARDAERNQPQILTQSGFQRFMSAEQLEAFRSPSQAPTKRTSPLEESTDRSLHNLGPDRPTVPAALDEPVEPDDSSMAPTKRTAPLAPPAGDFADEVTTARVPPRHAADPIDDEGPATLPATHTAASARSAPPPAGDFDEEPPTLPGTSSTDHSGRQPASSEPSTLPASLVSESPAANASQHSGRFGNDAVPATSPQSDRPSYPDESPPSRGPVSVQSSGPADLPTAGRSGGSLQKIPVVAPSEHAVVPRDERTGPVAARSKQEKSARRRTIDIIVVAALAVLFVGVLVYVLFLAD